MSILDSLCFIINSINGNGNVKVIIVFKIGIYIDISNKIVYIVNNVVFFVINFVCFIF